MQSDVPYISGSLCRRTLLQTINLCEILSVGLHGYSSMHNSVPCTFACVRCQTPVQYGVPYLSAGMRCLTLVQTSVPYLSESLRCLTLVRISVSYVSANLRCLTLVQNSVSLRCLILVYRISLHVYAAQARCNPSIVTSLKAYAVVPWCNLAYRTFL